MTAIPKILAPIIVTFALLATASARLGETYEQCVARYGQPTEKLPYDRDNMPGVEIYRFKSDKWGLAITFWKGKAYSIAYYTLDRSSPDIAPGERDAIMEVNVPNARWIEKGRNVWTAELSNDIASATYVTGTGHKSLIVGFLSYDYATQQYLGKRIKGL